MRKIVDCAVLKNNDTFEEITAMDFRKSPGEVFRSVELGKTFLVTRGGKAVAVISKPPGEALAIVVERLRRSSNTCNDECAKADRKSLRRYMNELRREYYRKPLVKQLARLRSEAHGARAKSGISLIGRQGTLLKVEGDSQNSVDKRSGAAEREGSHETGSKVEFVGVNPDSGETGNNTASPA